MMFRILAPNYYQKTANLNGQKSNTNFTQNYKNLSE